MVGLASPLVQVLSRGEEGEAMMRRLGHPQRMFEDVPLS